ncbi:hypothetical protein V8E51_017351 [Hyaloscypha variabilis]
MPSRASHLKSRRGCQQCKKRRIKCDETHPVCLGCTKHGISCSFNTPPPQNPNSQIADPVSPSQLLDLKLLHQFTSETYISITEKPNIHKLYRTKVIDTGFQYNYLLHSVLAVTAFHLFRTELKAQNPEGHPHNQQFESFSNPQVEKYLAAGHKHHNRALQSLHLNLPNITQENCHAIFVA